MTGWNKKNVLRMLLYALLYAIGTVVVSVLGSVHPVLFVCYQITAGFLLTGIAITAFRRIQALGVAVCLAATIVLVFIAINDLSVWHVAPLIVMALAAEAIRAVRNYDWPGDMAAAAIMSFSTFGFYGQIWLNRAFTYEAAVEEMPAGYADALMALSPDWAFPVVIIVGLLLSCAVSKLTARMFKLS